jgi:addiction module RelB/DinJ family antitoxin
MSKTAVYQLRLDEQEKQEAFAVLAELGISPAQAIRVFLRQVVATRSIPFQIEAAVRTPIAPTPAVITPSVAPKPLAEHDVFDRLDGLFNGLDQ